MNIKITGFIAAALLAISAPVFAKPVARQTIKALNLTKAQKQQFKGIRQQARQNLQPLRAQLEQNREALRAAVKSGDQAQIQSLSKTQGELAGQAMAIRSQTRSQIYAGLTPEQRQKMDAAQ